MSNPLEEFERRMSQGIPLTRDDLKKIQGQEREAELIAKQRAKNDRWMTEHRDEIFAFLPEWEEKLQAEQAIQILAQRIGRPHDITRTLQHSNIFNSITDNEIVYKISVARFAGVVSDIQPTGRMLHGEDQLNERASRSYEYPEMAMTGTKQVKLEDDITITLTQDVRGITESDRRFRSPDYFSQELFLETYFRVYTPENRTYKKNNLFVSLPATAQVYELQFLYNGSREPLHGDNAQRIFLSHIEGLYKAWQTAYKK